MTGPAGIRSPLPEVTGLHRVGKLRAGIKKSSTKDGKTVSFPSAVDYFVVNADASTSEQAATSFHQRYGEEPRELDVVLPADRPDEVLQGAWRMYGTGGLLKRKCQGPGQNCTERVVGGEWVDGPCACDRDGFGLVDDKRRCAERWTLSVLLMDVTGLGVWHFDTGSPMAARDMTSMLNLIHGLRGTLLRAECKLRLVPRQVAPKGVAKTVYIAQLDSSGTTPAEALALVAHTGESTPQLPPSSLDEAPDPLLDHEAALQVVEAPSSPPPPPPPPRPAPPGTADPTDVVVATVGVQLRNMDEAERLEIYRLAGIPRGSKTAEVRALICGAWDLAGLPDFGKGEPDLVQLLKRLRSIESSGRSTGAEAFQHFADTGESIEPGDQTSMYGPGSPA